MPDILVLVFDILDRYGIGSSQFHLYSSLNILRFDHDDPSLVEDLLAEHCSESAVCLNELAEMRIILLREVEEGLRSRPFHSLGCYQGLEFPGTTGATDGLILVFRCQRIASSNNGVVHHA